MDSDKILVMEKGKNVEFNHPYKLLQYDDGYLTNMVRQTGVSMSRQLREIARESYHREILET